MPINTTTSKFKASFLPSSNHPNNTFSQNNCFNVSPKCVPKSLRRASSSSLTVKCGSNNNGGPEQSFNLKDALNNVVGEQVQEILNREENRALLDGLEKAALRVEKAKRELAEIERQELEAKQMREYVNQLEKRASEIEECQKEISEARAMVEEAERSLSQGKEGIYAGEENEEINKDKERLESIKAASISALVGSIAGLPISLAQVSTNSQLILPLAITFVSCALFGVTFRYTIRRDLDDVNLKTGACAAFGVVKGLATLSGGQPLELNIESILSHALDGAIHLSQDLFVFVSAAVALDYCFKMGLLSPFPIKISTARTKDR